MALNFGSLATLGVVATLFQIVGLVLFILGFFPVKPTLEGISGPESYNSGCGFSHLKNSTGAVSEGTGNFQHNSGGVPAKYDRVILMVVDGLPAEFLLGKDGRPPREDLRGAMPYTQGLLTSGAALGFHARAAPPTVTMPRLKAMTSGTIAGFLDVAYNFNTKELLDDNLIGQLALAGWRMVMLGDNTWLKLFPSHFHRHDGVSSFFEQHVPRVYESTLVPMVSSARPVWYLSAIGLCCSDLGESLCFLSLWAREAKSLRKVRVESRSKSIQHLDFINKVKDTVEVDNNVTRHLNEELGNSDWNLLILHFLGLDHVGHLGGRRSPLMASKLKEMDAIIARIYTTVLSKDRTLLLVVSDHGMTDGGNHGGATYEETDALALFVMSSPEFERSVLKTNIIEDTVFQVDLVPTIALLLGVPIPKNSVGALVQPLFSSLQPEIQLRALELNSWQLFRILRRRFPQSECTLALCQGQALKELPEFTHARRVGDDAYKFCALFSYASEKHKGWLQNGSNLSDFTEVTDSYLQFLHPTSEWLATGSTEKRLNLILGGGSLVLVSTALFLVGCYHIMKRTTLGYYTSKDRRLGISRLLDLVAIGGVCVHAASFGSSSFVEEEQFTWHFMSSTLLLTLLRLSLKQSTFEHVGISSAGKKPGKMKMGRSEKEVAVVNIVFKICVVLILGRLLRSWHRSGVNWVHLPDVAKSLESFSSSVIANVRIASLVSVTGVSCWVVSKSLPAFIRWIMRTCFVMAAFLIYLYFLYDFQRGTEDVGVQSLEGWGTLCARALYVLLGATFMFAFAVFPWVYPSGNRPRPPPTREEHEQISGDNGYVTLESTVAESTNAVGTASVSCWCLLQLLLQQPVNAAPVLLLLLQLIVVVNLLRRFKPSLPHWISVLTLYWLGASGHFSLGNTNTLATVDVAGAYIGLSAHSTMLSGLLAFAITYGSPLLFMQALLLSVPHASQRKGEVAMQDFLVDLLVPLFLPMAMNSVVLTVFTGILYFMQDHLFVWSVFSPKYLYVVATTVCTYFGSLNFGAVAGYSFLVAACKNNHEPRKLRQKNSTQLSL